MGAEAQWTEHRSLSRPALALFGLIIVLMALSGLTLWRTTIEANHVDSERTALALRNAVAGEAAELLAIAADNAQWDDAASALYDGEAFESFVETNFSDSSADGTLYDGVVAMRRDGSILINLRRGEPSTRSPEVWIGPGLYQLMHAVQNNGIAHGLLSGSDGVRLVGMAMVTPTSADRLATHHAANHEPIYLAFTRPLSSATVAAIGTDLVLHNVSLGSPGLANGLSLAGVNGFDLTTLRDIDGRDVATLRWHPSLPGNRAIARSTPFILMALLTGLLAGILLLRSGYASVSEINRIALLDSLSELPNRRALRRLTRRALRDHDEVALAFVDLDGFKAVNDLYGHGVGDELIIQCARYISTIPLSPGGAARLGGDEFALLAFGPGARHRLIAAADALLARMREPFMIGDRTISVGASIGLACRETAGTSASELMRQADVAMYAAKNAGKMRWTWFDMCHDTERAAAIDIERRLRFALDTASGFELVYQPMIAAHDGAISGFEALLRWDGGGGEAIGPDKFIPIAEDTGLIDKLGELVLRRACTESLAWADHSVSVNVSAAQLRNPHYPGRLAAILSETGFPANRLIVEITESYVVSDPLAARRVIDALRAQGVRVALDDFGTGYASIGFLRQFTFDILKIDRALVAEAMADNAARALLLSSIAVARALDMATVAEGIENEAQAVIMRSAGCDLLQGWHFAREGDASSSATMIETFFGQSTAQRA
jgi:diguanylate cyclase (GGDEF)-like protein